jgi:hypothetical protein
MVSYVSELKASKLKDDYLFLVEGTTNEATSVLMAAPSIGLS